VIVHPTMQRPSSMETFNGCLGNAATLATQHCHQPGHGLRRVRAEAAGAALRAAMAAVNGLGFDVRCVPSPGRRKRLGFRNPTFGSIEERQGGPDLVMYDGDRSSTPRT